MKFQKYFEYQFTEKKDSENFFTNSTNIESYNMIINYSFESNIFLYGPKKSGKSHLLNIWKENNKAIIYNNNFKEIISLKKNVAIDNILENLNEEQIFHIINHCKFYNLKILATSSINLNDYSYKLKDLFSRLRSFYYVSIKHPDEEICKIIMTKLFHEKQIIIKNNDIFDYIFNRVNRTYEDIYLLVQKLDNLSLEKKRQLTIPLIREIL